MALARQIMDKKQQQGFLKITTTILLLITLAGIVGFYLYSKGLRIQFKSEAGTRSDINTNTNSIVSNPSSHNKSYYYTVQVSMTPYRKQANKLAEGLQQDGYKASIVPYENENGYYYKVQVGEFEDQQTARAVTSQIKKRYTNLKDSFYRRLDK